MSHHKRRRPRNQRAGCKMCKPWKINGAGDSNMMEHPEKWSDYKRRKFQKQDMEEDTLDSGR